MIRMPEGYQGRFHCLQMTSGYTAVTTRNAAKTPQDTPGQHRDASGRIKDVPDGYTEISGWGLFLSRMSAYWLGIFMITLRWLGGKY